MSHDWQVIAMKLSPKTLCGYVLVHTLLGFSRNNFCRLGMSGCDEFAVHKLKFIYLFHYQLSLLENRLVQQRTLMRMYNLWV